MTEVRVGVLGPTSVSVGGVHVALRSVLARRLLAALVLHRPAGASVDRLADELWGDELPERPAAALANHVARVRSRLGAGAIEGFPGGYRLGALTCDVDDFESLVGDGQVDDPDRRRAALALWRGHPYAELDSDAARAESARLEELRLSTQEGLAEVLLRAGQLPEAVATARWLVEHHPVRERPRVVLAEALAASGRRAEALRSLDDLRRLLVDELGIDMSSTAVALEQRLLDTAEEPLRRRPVHQVEPLVGRDDLLEELEDLIELHRLVTLTGPGGVGKTALATAVAAKLSRRIVGFVELQGVEAHGDVAAAIAAQLGIDRSGPENWVLRLTEALAHEHGLLVLDNAEHVVDGVAAIATELLRSTPMHLMVTSRATLALTEERTVAVTPLTVSADARNAAVALFVTSARRVRDRWDVDQDDIATIARICGQVDGLPLGIELAAAQLRYRSLEEIAERLDRSLETIDGTGRNRERRGGLRAVLDRSWMLLEEQDRHVLARVALFLGGFNLRTTTGVCSQLGLDEATVEASLDRLIDASLLGRDDRRYGTRYSLLDTVRRHALGRLGHELASERDRHARAILAAVEDGAREAYGREEPAWAERLEDERADILAAFEHFVEQQNPTDALRLANAAYLLALPRRHVDLAELPRRAVACLDHDRTTDCDPRRVVEALGMAADAATLSGAHEQARALIERSRVEGGSSTSMRYCLAVEADLALYVGDVDTAIVRYTAAGAGFEAEGQHALAAWMHASVALARSYGAHPDDQVGAALAALERADRSGCTSAVAFCRYVYAEVVRSRDAAEAHRQLDVAVHEATVVGADFVAGLARVSLATAARDRGDFHSSAKHLRSLLDLWRRLGNWTQQWITVRAAATLLSRTGHHRDALIAIESVRRHAPVDAWGEDAQGVAEASAAASGALGPRVASDACDLARSMSPTEVVHHVRRAVAEVESLGQFG